MSGNLREQLERLESARETCEGALANGAENVQVMYATAAFWQRFNSSFLSHLSPTAALLKHMPTLVFRRGETGHGATPSQPTVYSFFGADLAPILGSADQSGRLRTPLWLGRIHRDDRKAYQGLEERRAHTGETHTVEYRYLHALTEDVRWAREHAWIARCPASGRY